MGGHLGQFPIAAKEFRALIFVETAGRGGECVGVFGVDDAATERRIKLRGVTERLGSPFGPLGVAP